MMNRKEIEQFVFRTVDDRTRVRPIAELVKISKEITDRWLADREAQEIELHTTYSADFRERWAPSTSVVNDHWPCGCLYNHAGKHRGGCEHFEPWMAERR